MSVDNELLAFLGCFDFQISSSPRIVPVVRASLSFNSSIRHASPHPSLTSPPFLSHPFEVPYASTQSSQVPVFELSSVVRLLSSTR